MLSKVILGCAFCLFFSSCAKIGKHAFGVFRGALGSIHESNKNERKVDYYKQRNHTSAQARERVFFESNDKTR